MAFPTYLVSIVTILVAIKIYLKLITGKCKSKARLDGKTVIVTGANTGLGKEVALDLAHRGARVILACRNMDAAHKARDDIITKTGNQEVVVHKLNLASLSSVRQFSKTIHETENRLDILVNNAGVAGILSKNTEDNLHNTMQINHLAPFLLTNLLLDLLKKSAPSRIIMTSSLAHRLDNLDPKKLNESRGIEWINYCNTKLCNILFSNELARKLEGTGVTCNSLHPGVVRTDVFRHIPKYISIFTDWIMKIYFKTPKEGAQTTIYLAVADEEKNTTGKYFENCAETTPSKKALNKELAQQIWKISEKLVNLQPHEKYY